MAGEKDTRKRLRDAISQNQNQLIAAAQSLVSIASPSPPGNTSGVAEQAVKLLRENIPGAEISQYEPSPRIVNVVARISSGRPGRRLIFNGHLDTFPIGEDLGWTVPPLGGLLKDGRIYGRGISDMKAGIAASIIAAKQLSENRSLWSGEIVITLAGDEETMGQYGTKWLLDNVDAAKGDVMVCGDVGSPRIVRFGEKGFVWVSIEATGSPAHGAHVHKGISAINRLRKALDAVQSLEETPVSLPDEVKSAIHSATEVSENLSGVGESRTLQRITVNIGTIQGGVSPNLIASHATAQCDIRLPTGVSTSSIIDRLERELSSIEGISWRALQTSEPNYTSPTHEICTLTQKISSEVLGVPAIMNMRVGASDSRLYRAAGVPTVVMGCTPYNMGAADEYVEVEDLIQVAQIHTLVAYDYLSRDI